MCVSVESYLQCIKFSGFVFHVCIFQRKETKGKKVNVAKTGTSSAGAYAVNGYNSWVHQSHLLMLIDTELVAAAPPSFQGSDFHVGFGTGRQKEADASCDQHVPDAVDVEVVLLRLHEGVQGHRRCGDGGARKQEKHPALPSRWVTAAPTDGAHSLKDTNKRISKTAHKEKEALINGKHRPVETL